MERWISESNPRKQKMLSMAIAVAGLILCVRSYDLLNENAVAGFLLGLLLTGMGLSSLFMSGKQSIAVDPVERSIMIEGPGVFRRSIKKILFSDIADISIGYLGKRTTHVEFYYLVLKLTNGREQPLFGPGYFYEGGYGRRVAEERKARLEGYLR